MGLRAHGLGGKIAGFTAALYTKFLVPAPAHVPVELALAIACVLALGLYGLLQPGEGGDDDDNGSGGGGGGLMQPVAMGAG